MSKKREKFIELALKRLKRAVDADSHNRKEAIEDLKFLNGDQWDVGEKQKREKFKRPVLQINMLPKYVDQVVGDERHNRPRIKVRPVDSQADVQLAKIREGLISNIEYLSNAEAIYDQAFEQTVSCGYGAWRVLTRYTEENPFIQEIYLERIKNPFLVFIDPDHKDMVGADAEWGFILERMPREEFEERYPGKDIPGSEFAIHEGLADELFYDEDTVTVAEYFVREKQKATLCQLKDGTVMTRERYSELLDDWKRRNEEIVDSARLKLITESDNVLQFPEQPNPEPSIGPDQSMAQVPVPTEPKPTSPPDSGPRPEIARSREFDQIVVKHYIITAFDVLNKDGLNGQTFPGKYVPIILVKGKERNIEGKDYVRSLIRDAKDPQKLLNYWHTAAAELIALQPKSPWIGTAKMFEGYEEDYAKANTENYPYLTYNVDPDIPGGRPTREGPGEPPVAIFTQIIRAEENIKGVLGMYNSDMGGEGPERTGAAIMQRQKPGDIGTYAFVDNLSRSIAHTGRIINEMIPEVYDTERDVRLRNVDESESFVPINTTTSNALDLMSKNPDRYDRMNIERLKKTITVHGSGARFNDIAVGKYSVVVTTGPSYATQRQESVEYLLRLIQSVPTEMAIGLDILVRNMDFRDAEELANRLRKRLPAGLVELKQGEEPPPPAPPNPEAVYQEMKAKHEEKKIELEQKKMDLLLTKIDLEKIKVLNEVGQSKGEIKNMIMEILSELVTPKNVNSEMEGSSDGR